MMNERIALTALALPFLRSDSQRERTESRRASLATICEDTSPDPALLACEWEVPVCESGTLLAPILACLVFSAHIFGGLRHYHSRCSAMKCMMM